MQHVTTTRRFCAGSAGAYTVSALNNDGNYVQYSLFKKAEGWVLTLVYGVGPHFYAPFETKKAALAHLKG